MNSERGSSSIRIIGLGNEFRGDDAIGLLAARRLIGVLGDRAEVVEAGVAGVELLELMKGAGTVFLIDAVRSGQGLGTIHRFDVSSGPIAPALFPRSTHAVGVAEVLELARTLGVLPTKVIAYGIEAGDTEVGHPLSPQVSHVLNEVVQLILKEVEASACTNSIS
ncbi:MAG: hydrogenase maturation protease [Nitrospira sp.]|nr:hydrogenase maturation protease [Nitrospira sp.]